MPSNADARARGLFYQRPDARPTDDTPDWLKSQFTQTSGQFQREDGSTGENWLSPGHIVRDANGNPCIETKTTGDLEHALRLPGGNIFHGPLEWPFVEDDEDLGTPARRWGVATDHPGIMLCGSGARRGGAVSGIAGHNAAMAVLEMENS